MSITPQQAAAFHDLGFLLLEGCLSAAELAAVRANLPALLGERSERTILERSGDAVRSIYGLHAHERAFALLARHPRIVAPVRALLGGDVYVYQSKLNTKAPFVGEIWDWHQDFIFWRNEDGMPAPRVVTAAVFLDDVTEFNGPMVVLPGSQREGVLPCEGHVGEAEGGPFWLSHLSARLKYSVDRSVLAGLSRQYGLYAPKAAAGSVLLFDANLVHASAPNISPFSRALMLYTYNHVDNAPPRERLTRPDFLVSRDARPVVAAAEGALEPERAQR